MKIIVTGGCGFVGSSLCLYLKKKIKNSQILSIDNLSKSYSKYNQKILLKNKIINKNINLGEFHSLEKIKFRADFIIDCSAEPAVEISRKKVVKVIESNFLSTLNILEKSKEDNSKIIFISSSRVYPIKISFGKFKKYKKFKKHFPYSEKADFSEQKSIYGFTKYSSEKLIEEYNLSNNVKYIINRCGLISGPGQYGKVEQGLISLWMWRHLNKINVTYLGHGGKGDQLRDVLFVEDFCKLILRQLKSFKLFENKLFCIGGGKRNVIKLKELTEMCKTITNNKVKVFQKSKTSIYDIPYYVTSLKKIKKLCGWEPKVDLNKGLKEIYNWMILNRHKIKDFF